MSTTTIDIESDKDFMEIYEKCKPFTLTSLERAYALYESCKYLINNEIEGDFVECGVWKGGSVMIMIYALLALKTERKIYLYDTFEGMSDPESIDMDLNSNSAKILLEEDKERISHVWAYSPEKEVKANILSTGYNLKNIFFVKGKVEETIPDIMPEKISLLRLDTDWYASTCHELKNLYPHLTKNGVLIIDDYGHWLGAKKAVDEYFEKTNEIKMMHRIDYTGRLIIK